MGKADDRIETVFSGVQKSVKEVSAKCDGLDSRVSALEQQPSSGNSSGTSIVGDGNVSMKLNEKTLAPIFVKAITEVLEKRDALRRAQEAKEEAKGKAISLEQLTQNCVDGWEALKEQYNKDVHIHNFYYKWYRATVKLLGIEYDEKTQISSMNEDGILNKIAERQEDILRKFDNKNRIQFNHQTIAYTFEPWPATKTFLRYIFQWKFWSDARVFVLVMVLFTSIFVNFVAFKHMNKWKNAEVKYELLYRMFSHSKNFTNEVQYLEKLFEEPEKNKEAIEKLREMK